MKILIKMPSIFNVMDIGTAHLSYVDTLVIENYRLSGERCIE